MSTEELYQELWGENPPAKMDNSLQAHIYRLRQTLERLVGRSDTPPTLVTRSPGYMLEFDLDMLDMNQFRRKIAESRAVRHDAPKTSHALLVEALLLWRGTPMQDAATGPLCQGVALQLEEEYMTAVEDRISLGIDCADPLHVIGELRRMSTSHPWRERITELLMLALYRSGRQAEAIEAYNQARWRLANDLGMEPSDHLRQRFQEILSQAPHLQNSPVQVLCGGVSLHR
ncbi:DNA-binding transcriptional activator of the SARP family [Frankia sp. CeD]|nr:DNA-binding transcriptional activator of the SARP family [Frankia sp. CeD]